MPKKSRIQSPVPKVTIIDRKYCILLKKRQPSAVLSEIKWFAGRLFELNLDDQIVLEGLTANESLELKKSQLIKLKNLCQTE